MKRALPLLFLLALLLPFLCACAALGSTDPLAYREQEARFTAELTRGEWHAVAQLHITPTEATLTFTEPRSLTGVTLTETKSGCRLDFAGMSTEAKNAADFLALYRLPDTTLEQTATEGEGQTLTLRDACGRTVSLTLLNGRFQSATREGVTLSVREWQDAEE